MLEPGTVVELTVVRKAPFGYFLSNGEEDVLLHHSEIPDHFHPDEKQTVFLYQDHQGRMTASLTIPDIRKGHYRWAEVAGVNKDLGVFVDIGLQKDLLISKDDLPQMFRLWPQKGDRLYCSMKTGKKNRLYGTLASEEVMRELSIPADQRVFNQNIKGTVYCLLLAGSLLITDEGYIGFIHQSERKEEPRLGERVEGRVVAVKEDGTVNVSLLPRSHEVIDRHAEQIYSYLLGRGGSMPYSDKSEAQDIMKRFSISKAAFKRALGKLMKEGKVIQKDGWTRIKDRSGDQ
jgi:hypothetical protein